MRKMLLLAQLWLFFFFFTSFSKKSWYMQTKGLSKWKYLIQSRSTAIRSNFFSVFSTFLFCSSEKQCVYFKPLKHLEKCWRQGLFRKNITLAQRDIADFGILAIKNNYNITSMTFDANADTFSMITASFRLSLKYILGEKTLTHYEFHWLDLIWFLGFNFIFISIICKCMAHIQIK